MKRFIPALCLLVCFGSAAADPLTLTHNGMQLRAELVSTGDDLAAKPVVLLLHGTLAHHRMEIIDTLQKAFRERGYSSLAINLSLGLSGREGMYDCAVPHRHRHTDAVEEIGLWFDWLKQQGVQSVVLFGHSRGGNQIARYAAEHDSAALHSAILAAPQTWDANYGTKDYLTRYGKSLAPLLSQAEALVAKGQGDSLLNPVDFIYCSQTTATAAAFVSYYQPDPRMDTPSLLAEVRKPVLVFAASEDTMVTDLEQKMARAGHGDHVQMITLDGADHFFRDLYAEDLADAAVAFIEAH